MEIYTKRFIENIEEQLTLLHPPQEPQVIKRHCTDEIWDTPAPITGDTTPRLIINQYSNSPAALKAQQSAPQAINTLTVNLTPPQADIFNKTCPYPLFVGGYASGKSFVLITTALHDLLSHRGANIAVYNPTYDLNRLNLEPRFLDALDNLGIPYTYNKSSAIIKVHGYGDIIFRSMDNPLKIIAYQVFRSYVDEIDTLTKIKATQVWEKIIARNRQSLYLPDGTLAPNRVTAYSTPESFNFTYATWGKEQKIGYEYVQAATQSNPHLPPAYIENLTNSYPAGLVKAYLQGEWCNLTQGTVYPYFTRETCHKSNMVRRGEPLHIGMDFNKYHMAGVVFNERLEIVDEFVDYSDTPAMCVAIKAKYPGHTITIYPDASGAQSRSTDATKSDISILQGYGFKVKARKANPRIDDRVVSVNLLFQNNELWVDTKACPNLTEALEQLVYDDNGVPDKKSGLDHVIDALGYRIAWDKMAAQPAFAHYKAGGTISTFF